MTRLLDAAAAAIILILPTILSAAGRDNAYYVKVEIKGIIQTQIINTSVRNQAAKPVMVP